MRRRRSRAAAPPSGIEPPPANGIGDSGGSSPCAAFINARPTSMIGTVRGKIPVGEVADEIEQRLTQVLVGSARIAAATAARASAASSLKSRGTADRTDPATAAPAAPPGSTPAAAAPTTGAACLGAHIGSTFSCAACRRDLGDREVDLGETLAFLGDHRTASVRCRILAQLHWPRHRVDRQVVVRDLRDFVPVGSRAGSRTGSCSAEIASQSVTTYSQ